MSTSEPFLWSRAVRLFHWLLAIALLLNLFVVEEGDAAHQIIGYVAVVSVVLRAVWGFCCSGVASFSSFPLSLSELKEFIAAMFRGEHPTYPGHNPFASWVYIMIWLVVLCLGLTGWLMTLDAFWREDLLEELHESLAVIVQVLIAFHLLGLATDSIKFKRRIWLSMITGHRSYTECNNNIVRQPTVKCSRNSNARMALPESE